MITLKTRLKQLQKFVKNVAKFKESLREVKTELEKLNKRYNSSLKIGNIKFYYYFCKILLLFTIVLLIYF